MSQTYQIFKGTNLAAIECLICGAISYNTKDIEHHYCGRCKRFHDDPQPSKTDDENTTTTH